MIARIPAGTFARAVRSAPRRNVWGRHPARCFTSSARLDVVKPFLLADIGEGIRECEIIQWFVEPGARVEEFDKICEVQSDKASVDIPSRFSGVIKRLHYEAGDMAKVGKALIDIEVAEEELEKVKDIQAGTESVLGEGLGSTIQPPSRFDIQAAESRTESNTSRPRVVSGKHAALATPAVRHISKELGVDITSISGTGKDGRVTKDDVHQIARIRDSGASLTSIEEPTTQNSAFLRQAPDHGPQTEEVKQLSNMEAMMFKSMTASLKIPHFLYADEVDVSAIFSLRKRINKSLEKSPAGGVEKLSIMPFLIKAMSLAMDRYPIINARVDAAGSKPALVMRKQHNIGIAMDTAQGLIVPVIKNVGALNVLSIAAELQRLQHLAKTGKLSNSDLTGGTITLSNIGNIGGTYVSPVIVEKEVAILAIGKMRTIPAFGEDGQIVKKEVINFSWSADHRVVDGATMARAAEEVRGFVEQPDMMLVHLH